MSRWHSGSGDWSDGSNWSGGVPDSSTATATIAAKGDYTVAISATESNLEIETVNTALLDASGATLQIAGILEPVKSFSALDGVVALAGGAIDGVSASSVINIGADAKVIDTDSGDNYFSPGGELSGKVVNRGLIEADLQSSEGIDVIGQFTNYGTVLVTNGDSFDSLEGRATNLNAIVVTDGGVDLTGRNVGSISASSLGAIGFDGSNSGTITTDGGVESFNDLSNTDMVSATDGAAVYFRGNLSNTGTLAISDSTVTLNADFSSALMAQFANQDDTISIGGVVNNTGQTLTVGTRSGFSPMTLSGEISGGVIKDRNSGLIFTAGPNNTFALLNDVDFQGVLGLSGASEMLGISDGLTLTTLLGAPGTVELTGDDSQLAFYGKQTFDNAQINIGNAGASEDQLSVVQGGVLTLGANLTIVDTALQSIAYLDTYVPPAHGEVVAADQTSDVGEIVNDGTIEAQASGGTFAIVPDIFVNRGSIIVINGDTLDLEPGTRFTNLTNGTLTGGSYEVDGGSTLQLNSAIVTDNADITLSGLGSVIQFYDSTTAMQVGLEASLDRIGALGSLSLLDGRVFDAANALLNAGLLLIAGGTLSAPRLDNEASGTVNGVGAISTSLNAISTVVTNAGAIAAQGVGALIVEGAVANSGSLTADGANLTIDGNLTGVGEATITGATLDFGADVAATQTVTFSSGSTGLLDLGEAQDFHGAVAGLAAGDAFDLSNFLFSNSPEIVKVTGTGAIGTDTDITVQDGSLVANLHLLNQFAHEFLIRASAYSLTSDDVGSATAGTLFQLAAPRA